MNAFHAPALNQIGLVFTNCAEWSADKHRAAQKRSTVAYRVDVMLQLHLSSQWCRDNAIRIFPD